MGRRSLILSLQAGVEIATTAVKIILSITFEAFSDLPYT
jgi:hypothetical protein